MAKSNQNIIYSHEILQNNYYGPEYIYNISQGQPILKTTISLTNIPTETLKNPPFSIDNKLY